MTDKSLADAIELAIKDTRSEGRISNYQARKILDDIRVHMLSQLGSEARRIASMLDKSIHGDRA